MSNGPCSSRLSFQSGTRSTIAASTSSGVSNTINVTKALALEAPQRSAQLGLLIADDVGTEVAIVPTHVAVLANPLR